MARGAPKSHLKERDPSQDPFMLSLQHPINVVKMW